MSVTFELARILNFFMYILYVIVLYIASIEHILCVASLQVTLPSLSLKYV